MKGAQIVLEMRRWLTKAKIRALLELRGVILVCFVAWSTTGWAAEGVSHFEIEAPLWSRFVTPQQSYGTQSLGANLGGDWLFQFMGRSWGLGGKVHLSQVSYQIGRVLREGIAIHLNIHAQTIHELDTGFSLIGYGGFVPWAQLAVMSREASKVNNNEIDRGTLATFSQAYGIEFGGQGQKKLEFWIFDKNRPLRLGIGFNARLIQYGESSTKTVSSQPDGNSTISLKTPVQLRSINCFLSLGSSI